MIKVGEALEDKTDAVKTAHFKKMQYLGSHYQPSLFNSFSLSKETPQKSKYLWFFSFISSP